MRSYHSNNLRQKSLKGRCDPTLHCRPVDRRRPASLVIELLGEREIMIRGAMNAAHFKRINEPIVRKYIFQVRVPERVYHLVVSLVLEEIL